MQGGSSHTNKFFKAFALGLLFSSVVSVPLTAMNYVGDGNPDDYRTLNPTLVQQYMNELLARKEKKEISQEEFESAVIEITHGARPAILDRTTATPPATPTTPAAPATPTETTYCDDKPLPSLPAGSSYVKVCANCCGNGNRWDSFKVAGSTSVPTLCDEKPLPPAPTGASYSKICTNCCGTGNRWDSFKLAYCDETKLPTPPSGCSFEKDCTNCCGNGNRWDSFSFTCQEPTYQYRLLSRPL